MSFLVEATRADGAVVRARHGDQIRAVLCAVRWALLFRPCRVVVRDKEGTEFVVMDRAA